MQGVTFCNDLNQAVFVTYVVFVYLCIFVVRSSVVSNPGAPALLSSSHNMQGVTTLHARRNNMQGVTFCKFLFEKSADFEVQFLALQEEIDGIFLSYIVVHGIPWVCEALAKSRHEFSQKSQSRKKLRLAAILAKLSFIIILLFYGYILIVIFLLIEIIRLSIYPFAYLIEINLLHI